MKLMIKTISVLLTVTSISLAFCKNVDAAAEEKKNSEISGQEYAVTATVQDGKIIISAKGKGGYHCNTAYPWKLITEQKTYTKQDAEKYSEESVVFRIDNNKEQKASLKFSICNNLQCIMETANLSW